MSAKDHNDHGSATQDHGHGHDHSHDHSHDHPHDVTPLAPLSPTPSHGFWKSLRELDGKAPWQLEPTNKEFPPGAGEDQPIDPLSRRNFFHLMGASLGLAGVAGVGCRRYEKEEIIPLSRRPEDQTPSTTLQYSTSFELGGSAHPLVATSFEGRPIKLDGNPLHPFASGGIVTGTKVHAGAHAFAQASILHLYDPDRSQNPLENGKDASMEAFRVNLAELRKAVSAGGMRVLSEATSSPTVRALRAQLEKQNVVWHEYEPISWDNERAGTKMAFGRSLRPLARLDACETIVTIDCDIFVEHPASMRYSRDFALSRKKGGKNGDAKMNRLWSVESVFSNTGAMADHRLGLRSELGLPFVMELDSRLGGGGTPQKASFLDETKVATFINVLVEELKANAGRAVVIAGRRQPAEVHALVARINQSIGAPGKTLDYVEDPDTDRLTHLESIKLLAREIDAGHVKSLVILGGNPVYDAPADLDFANLLKKAGTTVHLSEYADETSRSCSWHVPRAHFLETWGDARTWDGTVTLAQPLIQPLYGGLSVAELLSLLLGNETAGEQLVREQHATLGIGNWRKNVHDGYVPGTQLPTAQVALQALPQAQLSPSQQTGSKRKNGELEVVYHYSSYTYDGRFANNAWLWETPDFLTKVVWDNYALVSPETATTLGIENDTMITVKLGDKSIELPCYTMPGQARYSIGLVLGGGRTEAGRVGGRAGHKGVGYDTYKVRTTAGFDFAIGASVTAGRKYELANVQDHWNYQPGNNKLIGNGDTSVPHFDHEVETRSGELVREVPASVLATGWKAEVEESEEAGGDKPEQSAKDSTKSSSDDATNKAHNLSLFAEHDYAGQHRWGMSIDLSSCTGCNACMVACQSENNVPVVGRKEVINNREMHWIRIDRYFQGSPEDPHVVHQPLTCQQCENAPCEQVCPVGATSHSLEGLNDMSYNRCIGTRYCANNCPYKVRRFNFLDWNKDFREARNKVRRLLFNPDVTVRMRGVMEKCTFCVQRIQNAKITAKAQARNPRPGVVAGNIDPSKPLPDGTVETACQMACPTEAIIFGDLSDDKSRVSEAHKDPRAYDLLPEVYTKPRNRYLTRVRNLNPKMPVASSTGSSATEGGHQ